MPDKSGSNWWLLVSRSAQSVMMPAPDAVTSAALRMPHGTHPRHDTHPHNVSRRQLVRVCSRAKRWHHTQGTHSSALFFHLGTAPVFWAHERSLLPRTPRCALAVRPRRTPTRGVLDLPTRVRAAARTKRRAGYRAAWPDGRCVEPLGTLGRKNAEQSSDKTAERGTSGSGAPIHNGIRRFPT